MPPPPTETMSERVVLIHAAVADSRMWQRQARGLQARGFDVVTPDLPGFGSEPVPAGPFSFVERIASLLPAMPTRSTPGLARRSGTVDWAIAPYPPRMSTSKGHLVRRKTGPH